MEREETSDTEGAKSLNYEELFAILMYYGNMTQKEILSHSKKFIYSIYKQHINRACENLGIPSTEIDKENNSVEPQFDISDEDYPVELLDLKQFQEKHDIDVSKLIPL